MGYLKSKSSLHEDSVKYSLADNMGQGKNPTVPSQSDAPEGSDLGTAWQLFPLDDDHTCHSKDGGSDTFRCQLWEEIAGAWRRIHISAWEFDGNIRSTNWTEESEKIPLFTKACLVVAPCANIYILLYILCVVVCLGRAERNSSGTI